MITSIICIVIAVDKIILTTVLSILVMNGTIATIKPKGTARAAYI